MRCILRKDRHHLFSAKQNHEGKNTNERHSAKCRVGNDSDVQHRVFEFELALNEQCQNDKSDNEHDKSQSNVCLEKRQACKRQGCTDQGQEDGKNVDFEFARFFEVRERCKTDQ